MKLIEPAEKRTIAFIDGQNLFNAAKEAFGYPYPNYDAGKLVSELCTENGWSLTEIRFSTGIPDAAVDPDRHHFWAAKLAVMGTRGVNCYARTLQYSNKRFVRDDGSVDTMLVGREKGIDLRLALDVVILALENRFDVALILSQDQDLTEAVDEVRRIAVAEDRWIKCASAYPCSPTSRNRRGINKTDWIRVDRTIYDSCLDPNDYRKKKTP